MLTRWWRGKGRSLAALAGAALATVPAGAQTLPALTLPTLALEPAPTPSIWHGLSVGTEVVAAVGHGGGGVGGDVFASYDRAFANNLVLGIRGSTGYEPGFGNRTFFKGFDFAAADVRLGYDMGRVMPYVTAGVALARPHGGAGLAAPGSESLDLVLNGAGETRALTRVGAGVDYAVTNNLTVGVAVNAVQAREPLLP